MTFRSRPGIVVALPQEARSLTSTPLRPGDSIEENGLLIGVSGMGAGNACRMAEKLADTGVTALISWGCAAGITDTAKPGDLFIPQIILDEQLRTLHSNDSLRNHMLKQLDGVLGKQLLTTPLLSSAQIIGSSAEKKRIASETSATAIDMESFAIGQIAEKNNLPFLAIRAIADPVDLTLPAIITDGCCMTPEGMIRPIPFVARLLSHPGTLIELIRIAICFASAKKTLHLAAETCRSGLPGH